MTEERLVEAMFERSETALAELERQYGSYCFTVANRIVCDEDEAAECVNDAYLRVWDSIPPQRPRSLKAYLASIVRNLALNRYKSRHAQKRGGDRTELVLSELQECVSSSESPYAVTDDIVIRDCLNRFLASLPKRERWVFVRRYWHMDSVKNIAAAMKLEEDSVYVMLSRLRKRLKVMLEKEGVVL